MDSAHNDEWQQNLAETSSNDDLSSDSDNSMERSRNLKCKMKRPQTINEHPMVLPKSKNKPAEQSHENEILSGIRPTHSFSPPHQLNASQLMRAAKMFDIVSKNQQKTRSNDGYRDKSYYKSKDGANTNDTCPRDTYSVSSDDGSILRDVVHHDHQLNAGFDKYVHCDTPCSGTHELPQTPQIEVLDLNNTHQLDLNAAGPSTAVNPPPILPHTNNNSSQIPFMTIIMFLITSYYIITKLPVLVFILASQNLFAEVTTEDELEHLEEIYVIFSLLFFSNYAVNFLFYCVSGRLFRRESCYVETTLN